MSKLYFYKCAHFLLFFSLSTFFNHYFHSYMKILTKIPLIPTPNSPHSRPDSLHSYPYFPHSHRDSPHSHHSHPDSIIPTIISRIITLIPWIPIIPLIPFPDSPFRLLHVALTFHVFDVNNTHESRRDIDLKSCQLTASEKSNILRKVHFLLKSSFQVIAFFTLVEGRIPCYNYRKACLQISTTIIFGTLKNNV